MGNSLVDEENFRVASFMRSKLLFTKLDAVGDFFVNLVTFTVANSFTTICASYKS